jgi:hypothetical protein
LGLVYLVAAVLDRPWTSWAVLVLSIPVVGAVKMLGIEPAVVPSYVVAPIITTLTMGYLERRSLTPGSRTL